jgi:hypothetical protein
MNNKGLPETCRYFIDYHGNKFFTTYSIFYGEFIRQIQTPDGTCIDCSSGDPFDDKMKELGFIGRPYIPSIPKDVLYHLYDNFSLLEYDVYNEGMAKELIEHSRLDRMFGK